jgi:hypothetical protein
MNLIRGITVVHDWRDLGKTRETSVSMADLWVDIYVNPRPSEDDAYTVKPVLNGISRVQHIFLLKPGFRLIMVYYDSHGTWKYFRLIKVRLRQVLLYRDSR